MPDLAAIAIRPSNRVPIDTDEILLALTLLSEPPQVIELRLLHVQPPGQRVPVTMSGYFNDYIALVERSPARAANMKRRGQL